MVKYKNFFLVSFQTKSFVDVNIFSAKNDFSLKLNLVYSFVYKNSFAFFLKNIPSSCIIQNQKNFFNFLTSCVFNEAVVTFFTNTAFKNIAKSLNFLLLSATSKFEKNLSDNIDVLIYLDDKFNNKVNSKYQSALTDTLIIKPISSDTKIDFQIYYLLIDLSSDLNKFIYLNLIKSFLFIAKQNLFKSNFKKFFFLKKLFLKNFK